MKTLSPYFFMEVLVKKLHATVDKFATLDSEGTSILYTTRAQPKAKQVIDLAEGQRIFEDLYGDISIRYEKSAQYLTLEARKAKSLSRKLLKKGRA